MGNKEIEFTQKDTMKIQLALDLIELEDAKRLVAELGDLIDIIEIGTPMIIRYGTEPVTEIRRVCSQKKVLADLKIMDAGAHEACIGFEAGADIVTVLAVADDTTIGAVVDQGRACDKEVMADLIASANPAQRAVELDGMGVDYVCVHTGTDVQATGKDPLEELRMVQPVLRHARMAVAGGIKPMIMESLMPFEPDIIIVGGFIASHENPRQAALQLRKNMV